MITAVSALWAQEREAYCIIHRHLMSAGVTVPATLISTSDTLKEPALTSIYKAYSDIELKKNISAWFQDVLDQTKNRTKYHKVPVTRRLRQVQSKRTTPSPKLAWVCPIEAESGRVRERYYKFRINPPTDGHHDSESILPVYSTTLCCFPRQLAGRPCHDNCYF